MCHEVSTHEDSDITVSSIRQAYSAYLQNGIGNQVNRILKLSSQYLSNEDIQNIISRLESSKLDSKYTDHLDNFKINEAVHIVTDKVKSLDEYIQSKAPFKLIKSESQIDKDEAKAVMRDCLYMLGDMSHHLYFFMPRTAMSIYNAINTNKMPEKALFNRTE
jgi:methionyl-tRNA synthetase